MQILTLMGGGSYELTKDDSYPVYMSEINGRMVLENHVDYCKEMSPTGLGFCIKAADAMNYRVDNVIQQLSENTSTFKINGQTKGALCTALLAYDYINNDEELLITAVNDFIEVPGSLILKEFRDKKLDSGLVYFDSIHPRYSFIKINDAGLVTETSEKIPVSRNALASFYYFRTGSSFVEAAKSVIRKDNRVNDSFYISQAINELILDQKKVGCHKIKTTEFHPLKSKLELARYMLRVKDGEMSKQ